TEWLAGGERDERGYILTGHDLLGPDGGAPGSPLPPPPPAPDGRTRRAAAAAGRPLPPPPLLLETSIPGVFAAGDVRHRSVKRVASAVGEGAVAVQLVHQ